MAWNIHSTDDGRTPGLEYLPCGASELRAGRLMKISQGKLAAAGGADQPAYLCMRTQEEPCGGGELIPVVRIQPDILLETEAPAGFSALPGARVQLTADGLGVTDAEGGPAEVVYADGDAVRVRFAPAP